MCTRCSSTRCNMVQFHVLPLPTWHVYNLAMPCCLTRCCSGLIASPPYTALVGLAAPGACRQGGAGEGLLAGLSSAMQTHLLR
jgi:hypothetical protein